MDWDVHHGNGTQNMFDNDPSVLYFSIHRYDRGHFYPGPTGNPKHVGKGPGVGFNVNVGWNTNGGTLSYGDGDYLAAWMHVLMPIALEVRFFTPPCLFIFVVLLVLVCLSGILLLIPVFIVHATITFYFLVYFQYDPELVLISAGFDAAEGDPLGGQCITPTGYAHLTHQLRQLAGGKVVLVLEGGYKYVS